MTAVLQSVPAVLLLGLDVVIATLLWRSLIPPRTALITRIVRLARGPDLVPALIAYSRGVTVLWGIVFSGCALMIGLGLLGAVPTALLPLVALGQGPLCALIFLAEYGFRRVYLRQLPHPHLLDYLRFLRRVDYRAVLRQ